MPLQISDSEESDAEEEEVTEWSEIYNPQNIEPFLGHVGVCVTPNNSDNIMDIVQLFI
jgi:hypothetical protein